MRGKEKVILLTTTTTWIKDSHSLFDYESPKILEMVFESPILPRSLTFYREKNCMQCNIQQRR